MHVYKLIRFNWYHLFCRREFVLTNHSCIVLLSALII